MYTIDTLDRDLDTELTDVVEGLSDLYGDVEKGNERGERKYHKKNYPDGSTQEGYYLNGRKDGEWIEILSNGTEKKITYKNGKKDGPYIEEWKGVYRREGQYKSNFREGKWIEIRNNGSRIEGQYDERGSQTGRWARIDSNGDRIEGEYKNGILVNGKDINFTF